MYVRRPLVQRCSPRRRFSRWNTPLSSVPSSTGVLTTATPAASTGISDNDFDHYVHAECSDTLFQGTRGDAHGEAPSATSPSLPSPPSSLHCGPEVAALPAAHAILNRLNSAVWLRVLACLQERSALSSRDSAGVVRHLPAFTFRPLLPWLWAPSTPAVAVSARALASSAAECGNDAELSASTDVCLSTNDDGAVVAEAYNNMSLVALEMAGRVSASTANHSNTSRAGVTEASHVVFTVDDFSTAQPQLWRTMALSLVAALPSGATARSTRLKRWHDILFTVRSHATWNTTVAELRDVAHPQLLELLDAFYADMRSHDTASSDEALLHRPCSSSATPTFKATTLLPPILLRSFRSLYRQHRHSAVLFAELYACCVVEEEKTVRRWRTASSAATGPHVASSNTETPVAHVSTTALLMDVDLAMYYASLPGRRHSGLATPAEQWAVTLQHLTFLLPRLHFLQRCLCARQAAHAMPASSSTPSLQADAYEPWQRVASVLMNVCMWVENDNQEATRCCAALRCAVEALWDLSAPQGSLADSCDSGRSVHASLGAPTAKEVARFVMTLMAAAGESMRAKTEQLNYGTTDGLFGVHLLSAATAAVLPASVHEATQAGDGSGRLGDTQHDAAPPQDAVELLQRLRLFIHPLKTSPDQVWSALRRTPHVADAARYGLVTVGYRLFRHAVVPHVAHPSTLATAQRLYGLLCDWAVVVGRPLGLQGRQVALLWHLRWAKQQEQHQEQNSGEGAAESRRRSTVRLLLQKLSAPRPHHHRSGHGPHRKMWVCGCGFHNARADSDADAAAASCVACVLRTMTPHSWECPLCHTSSDSGVYVPYCLHCGEAHPCQQLSEHHRRQLHVQSNVSEEEGEASAQGFVYVCAECHTVAAEAPAPQRVALQTSSLSSSSSKASAATVLSLDASQSCHCCSACGSQETVYATAAFTWVCGCGASNSAIHDFCHACSRATGTATLTCPQCHHTAAAANAARCERCHHPHPRHLAAVTQTRLVRCPACQGLTPATSSRCPHCASMALSVVAALLPTVADQPWWCLHCGNAHPVRSLTTKQLRAPPPLYLRGVAFNVAAPVHACRAGEGRDGATNEDCCEQCGTRRVPASTWESSRLWSCASCGEVYNMEAACRRCAALAPGVPVEDVFVWRCAICQVGHPSWTTHCSTPGCGGTAQMSLEANNTEATDRRSSGAARYCYSPWECPACAQVTLSSHLPCCSTCDAPTPAAVASAECTTATCVKATTAVGTVLPAVAREEAGVLQPRRADLNHTTAMTMKMGAAADDDDDDDHHHRPHHGGLASTSPKPRRHEKPSGRLAEVEAFLLRAAEVGVPPHGGMLDVDSTRVVPARPPRSNEKAAVAADAQAHTGVSAPASPSAVGGPCRCFSSLISEEAEGEAWEDAYRAAVLSF
jgi:hypothetical protein